MAEFERRAVDALVGLGLQEADTRGELVCDGLFLVDGGVDEGADEGGVVGADEGDV